MFILLLALFLCVGCVATPSQNSDSDTDFVDENSEQSKEENAPNPQGSPAQDSYLNGVELSKFSIVYSVKQQDYTQRAAEYIQAEIFARTEIEIPVAKETDVSTTDHEIVVGDSQRSISKQLEADTKHSQFSILATDNTIAMEGDYFVIAAAAYFFVETYIPEDNFSAEIPKEVSIHEPIVKEAKNYILLIGDGMGLYQTLLFDVMKNTEEYGDREKTFYGYYFPAAGFARTWSLSEIYTDSAAAGTALATGHKTYNGYVGQKGDRGEVPSLTELAASLGMSTAVMSTEPSTGATPAAFSAHANSRQDSSDILADQTALKNKSGTIIDCNYDYYTAEKVDLIKEKIRTTLNTLGQNEKGFFLMYEEAHIDKHCHKNDLTKTFQAVVRFNQAIATFMEYAFYHPDTFVLITADHETGELLPNDDGGYSFHFTDHSSYYVPVFAYGAGSELFDGKIIENIQIPQTIATFMGVPKFGDQTKFKPLK